jgi:hypothetical protein
MPRIFKAWLVTAVMGIAVLGGGLSAAGVLADVGIPQVTSTSGDATTTESTAEEGSELPPTTGEVTSPDVTDAQMISLRHQVVQYRRQTCYWQRYAFLRCAKAKYMERWETEISKLQRLARWWKVGAVKAKRYAQSFKYADRYLPPLQARIVGQRMAAKFYHWVGQQWVCLDKLWGHMYDQGKILTLESGWYVRATNGDSGAYGIPQAYPAIKLASMGRNWLLSVYVQLKWGLRYVLTAYGSPCAALNVRLSAGGY